MQCLLPISSAYTLYWIVVVLYVYKLRQLKIKILSIQIDPHHSNNAKTRQILDHINLQLNKVLFLTLIMELAMNIILQLHIWDSVNYDILGWLDFLITLMALYLMLEHNQIDYLRFLLFWTRIGCIKKCCCCFKNLSNTNTTNTRPRPIVPTLNHCQITVDTDANMGKDNDGNGDNGKSESMETHSMEVAGLEYVDQSAKTQTDIV